MRELSKALSKVLEEVEDICDADDECKGGDDGDGRQGGW